MFEQLGAVLAGAPAERERTPVRRQSRAAGKCEAVFWRRTNTSSYCESGRENIARTDA